MAKDDLDRHAAQSVAAYLAGMSAVPNGCLKEWPPPESVRPSSGRPRRMLTGRGLAGAGSRQAVMADLRTGVDRGSFCWRSRLGLRLGPLPGW